MNEKKTPPPTPGGGGFQPFLSQNRYETLRARAFGITFCNS